MIQVKTALSIVRVLWPDFVERDGMVLLAASGQQPIELSKFRDRTDAESFYNHVHVFDCFRHAVPTSMHPEHGYLVWEMSHPNFERACELGRRMARMWLAKLGQDYPDRRFRVYWTKLDDPIVRFHQVRAEEPPWAPDDYAAPQVAAGAALILETPVDSAAISAGHRR